MFTKPNRLVGTASGFSKEGLPVQGGREIISTLLDIQADQEMRRQAIKELSTALDSLAYELECW
ncbi:MAG: hypothetical protein ABIH67_04610 [Candidatus Uhrbacteria bacterium]